MNGEDDMADQKDLDFSYTLIDKVFRYCFGEAKDFSSALYNGDFSMSLEEAQRRKHEFIAENLNIGKGSRVLDMGCGWGPFLKYVKEIGAEGIGITLSRGQADACRKNGFNVHLMDCRKVSHENFGKFDAITSIEAFEAFCSKEEWQEGKQDEVYESFFKIVYDLLPVGGRFYLQTGTFGKNMFDPDDVNINADKNSDAYIAAFMLKQFPGHWLPWGADQIITDAKPYFKLISMSNGRLDYVETQRQWREKFRKFSLEKLLFYLSLFPSYITSKDLRNRIYLFGVSANKICFEREIMDHFRFVFEKI